MDGAKDTLKAPNDGRTVRARSVGPRPFGNEVGEQARCIRATWERARDAAGLAGLQLRAGRQAYAGSPLELIGAYAMKTLAVVVLLLFGPAAGSGESPGRSLMARAHCQAVASTKALAVARYHQRRLTTVLDDSGASRGASRDASVDGSDSLDLSASTIFQPGASRDGEPCSGG